ncbi:uncharacterized protein V6R79_022907 [Siganus canaliculatus]
MLERRGAAWSGVDHRGAAWRCVERYGSAWITVERRGAVWIGVEERGAVWIGFSSGSMRPKTSHGACKRRRIRHEAGYLVFLLQLRAEDSSME